MKLVTTAVLLFSLGSLRAYAQSTPATWQGHFISNGELHCMVMQADQAADGRWTARSFSVDFLPDTVKLDTASFQDGHVAASTNTGKGAYDAHLNPDGTILDGTWTWDKQPVAVKLKRVPNEAAWHTPMNYQYHHKDVTYARPSPDEPKIPFTPRLAVDYMEQGAMAWTEERGCISCHSNGTYMMVRPGLSVHGSGRARPIRCRSNSVSLDSTSRILESPSTLSFRFGCSTCRDIWDSIQAA